MDINIAEERERLADIWKRTLKLCEILVRDVEEGKSTMRATVLRELNQFLKASVDILDRLEELNRKNQAEQGYDTDDDDDVIRFPVDGDNSDSVPFPVDRPLNEHQKQQALPLKTE